MFGKLGAAMFGSVTDRRLAPATAAASVAALAAMFYCKCRHGARGSPVRVQSLASPSCLPALGTDKLHPCGGSVLPFQGGREGTGCRWLNRNSEDNFCTDTYMPAER